MKSYTKLYASPEAIDSRFCKGGEMRGVSEITTLPAVLDSFVLINILAMENKMYPLAGPFKAFDYCKLSDIECIIVGGMPTDDDAEKLRRWLGPSYAYEIGGLDAPWRDNMFEWICYNQFATTFRINNIHRNLRVLQENGVLLLPEILSTFVGGNKIMEGLWEPFIWNFLAEFTTTNPEIPVIFTTESAQEKFLSATDNSQFKAMALIADRIEREENKTLKAAEIQVRRNGRRSFNFFDLASR